MKSVFASLILFFGILGCTHQPPHKIEGVEPIGRSEYASLIKRHTAKTDQYSGFYQTFQAELTMLTREVLNASLTQKAYFLQWDRRQFNSEREKIMQESNAYSTFFMRFFSPETDYDDFHKGKTIWKVYLEVSGSRFEGKVRKLVDKFVELQTLYPQLDRFSTPYEITFNVPMPTVENGGAKVILTSSLGHAEFVFPAQK